MRQKISQLAEDARSMTDQVREIIPECSDYDLQRLLKRLDAELMDVRHNLQLALRLMGEDN